MSIEKELKNAGLLGLPFSWGADGSVTYGAGLTEEQRTAIAVAVAAGVGGEVKAKREAQIRAMRDSRRFNGGVKVGAYWFKTDQVAVGEYAAMALMAAALPDATVLRADWRTMEDGVIVDMTAGLVRQILTVGFAAVAANDDAAEAHIAALGASQDPASYDYSTGWPAIFGEPEE